MNNSFSQQNLQPKTDFLTQKKKSNPASYIVTSFLFLFVVFMLVYILRQNTPTKNVQRYTVPTLQTTPSSSHYENLLNSARHTQTQDGYINAANSFLSFASKDSNQTERYRSLLQAATLFANAGQYQKALAIFKQSEQYSGITYSECQGAGLISEKLGDKKGAISYFQKCLEIMPSDYPGSAQDRQRYEDEIKQLQK